MSKTTHFQAREQDVVWRSRDRSRILIRSLRGGSYMPWTNDPKDLLVCGVTAMPKHRGRIVRSLRELTCRHCVRYYLKYIGRH